MDLSLITILFSFILSILFSLYYLPSLLNSRKNGSVSLQTPPGKMGLPFIGETIEFLSNAKKGFPEKFVLDRVKKYSSNVFKTSLFGEPFALLCSPEGNKFLFSNENKLVKTWWPRSIKIIFNPPESLDSHFEQTMLFRKFLSPYFKPDALKKYVPIMDLGTKQHLRTYWEGRDVVEVHALAKKYTFTLVCRLFVGVEDEETVWRLEEQFSLLTRAMLALPLNFPGTTFYASRKAKERLLKDMDALIKRWKSDFSEGRMSPSQSVLAEILKETFEDDDFSTKILKMLVAAYGTTSATLTAIIVVLAEFPLVYQKVLAEQMEIARSKAQQEMLNWEDIQKMKYSWNVASEVLRMYPPGHGTFREAISDFTYDGFLIPKGYKLHLNFHATHRNVECFKNPEKFDPSRYEGDGPIPYSYVPFGGGPRMCPGNEYARIKILVFMHNVVTKFKWGKVFPDEKIIWIPFSEPAKGLPIRLYPMKFPLESI